MTQLQILVKKNEMLKAFSHFKNVAVVNWFLDDNESPWWTKPQIIQLSIIATLLTCSSAERHYQTILA